MCDLKSLNFKVVLYFLVYSSMVLGLFVSFMYLMTVVDPDLMNLPQKATIMYYHSDHSHSRPGDDDEDNKTMLPPELYKDFKDYTELLANITRNVNPD